MFNFGAVQQCTNVEDLKTYGKLTWKIGFDTAGKEPSKVYQEFDSYIDSIRPNTGKPGRRFARAVLYWRLREPRDRAPGPPRLRGGQRVDRLSLPKKSGLLLLLGCHPNGHDYLKVF